MKRPRQIVLLTAVTSIASLAWQNLATAQGWKKHVIQEGEHCNTAVAGDFTGDVDGGEKRRVALCQLQLQNPNILLLDEPTNHLDAESVGWLERFLREFPGTAAAAAITGPGRCAR